MEVPLTQSHSSLLMSELLQNSIPVNVMTVATKASLTISASRRLECDHSTAGCQMCALQRLLVQEVNLVATVKVV